MLASQPAGAHEESDAGGSQVAQGGKFRNPTTGCASPLTNHGFLGGYNLPYNATYHGYISVISPANPVIGSTTGPRLNRRPVQGPTFSPLTANAAYSILQIKCPLARLEGEYWEEWIVLDFVTSPCIENIIIGAALSGRT